MNTSGSYLLDKFLEQLSNPANTIIDPTEGELTQNVFDATRMPRSKRKSFNSSDEESRAHKFQDISHIFSRKLTKNSSNKENSLQLNKRFVSSSMRSKGTSTLDAFLNKHCQKSQERATEASNLSTEITSSIAPTSHMAPENLVSSASDNLTSLRSRIPDERSEENKSTWRDFNEICFTQTNKLATQPLVSKITPKLDEFLSQKTISSQGKGNNCENVQPRIYRYYKKSKNYRKGRRIEGKAKKKNWVQGLEKDLFDQGKYLSTSVQATTQWKCSTISPKAFNNNFTSENQSFEIKIPLIHKPGDFFRKKTQERDNGQQLEETKISDEHASSFNIMLESISSYFSNNESQTLQKAGSITARGLDDNLRETTSKKTQINLLSSEGFHESFYETPSSQSKNTEELFNGHQNKEENTRKNDKLASFISSGTSLNVGLGRKLNLNESLSDPLSQGNPCLQFPDNVDFIDPHSRLQSVRKRVPESSTSTCLYQNKPLMDSSGQTIPNHDQFTQFCSENLVKTSNHVRLVTNTKTNDLLDCQALESLYRMHESCNWDAEDGKKLDNCENINVNNENLTGRADLNLRPLQKSTDLSQELEQRLGRVHKSDNATLIQLCEASEDMLTLDSESFTQTKGPGRRKGFSITKDSILFGDNLLKKLIEEKPRILESFNKNKLNQTSWKGPSDVLAQTYIKRYSKGKMRIFKLKKRFKQPDKSYQPPEDQIMDNFIKRLQRDFKDAPSSDKEDRQSVSTPSSYVTDDALSDVLSSGSSKLLDHQKLLREGINKLSKDSTLLFSRFSDSAPVEFDKAKILLQIQGILCGILEDYEQGQRCVFNIPKESLSNCVFRNERYQLKEIPKFTVVCRRPRFNLILFILNKIRVLLETGVKLTKREIYYQLKSMLSGQWITDRTIKDISRMLNVGSWALNVTAQKGLVYGNLKLVMANGETINCNVPGTLVPQDVSNICEVHSEAYFILVVEKECIFHKLLEENLPNRLTRPFILITGKGFPDFNTQLFLKKLWMIMAIPVFILVDADPSGIAIMLNYRFGSVASAHVSQHLAIPKARWIGVFPSEILKLDLNHQVLTKGDIRKTQKLLQLQCVQQNPKIKEQVEVFLQDGLKTGIEGVMKTDTYLSHRYLTVKFYTNDLI